MEGTTARQKLRRAVTTSMKKGRIEKGLVDIKEIGFGSLNKGISFLRQGSSNAGLDEEKAPPASRKSSIAVDSKPKMSYDELLSLSMKLTKQNRSYKAQLTSAADKIFHFQEIETNYTALAAFVVEDVGVDLIHVTLPPPPSSSNDTNDGEQEKEEKDDHAMYNDKVLNTAAMRQLYHNREAVREQLVRERENMYVQEINALKEKKRIEYDSQVTSKAKMTMGDDSVLGEMEWKLHAEEEKRWQSKLTNCELALQEFEQIVFQLKTWNISLEAALTAAEANVATYAADIQKQVLVIHEREEALALLRCERQSQTTLLQERDELRVENDTLQRQLADAAKDQQRMNELEAAIVNLQTEAKLSMAQHLQEQKELETRSLAQVKAAVEDKCKMEAKVAALEKQHAENKAEVMRLMNELATMHKSWSEKNALSTRLQTEHAQLAESSATAIGQLAVLQQSAAEARTQCQLLQEMVATLKADVVQRTEANKALEVQLAAEKDRVARLEANEALEAQRWSADTKVALAKAARLHQEELERVEGDARQKSKLARQLVLEKEEIIAKLSASLAALEHDVKSGGADDRRIFELASIQAQREAAARSQEAEVVALQAVVAEKASEVDELRLQMKTLEEDIAVLVRTERREGVNMEYLKNVVVQYMSFSPGSSQQMKLIPVLSTLLQFTPQDMEEIKASSKRMTRWSWNDKNPVKIIVPPPSITIPSPTSGMTRTSPRSYHRSQKLGRCNSWMPSGLNSPTHHSEDANSPKQNSEHPLLHNSDSIDL